MQPTCSLFLLLVIVTGVKSKIEIGRPDQDWDYWKQNDAIASPDEWRYLDASFCKEGYQSPIDVPLAAVRYDSTRVTMTEFAQARNDFKLYNLQRNIVLRPDARRGPYVFVQSLNKGFYFQEASFRWGLNPDTNAGSEHRIYGKQYALEMQLYFYPSDTKSVQEALDDRKDVVVLSVFFAISYWNNPNLDKIIGALTQIRGKTSDEPVPIAGTFNLNTLIPARPAYYFRYMGSLNIPNCNPKVTWILFSTPLTVGVDQMRVFTATTNAESADVSGNVRPLQPLDGRTFYLGTAVNG